MNWKDINVFQWQQLMNVFSKAKEHEDIDIAYDCLAILYNKTHNQIDSLSVGEVKSMLKNINFIHSELTPSPAKFIYINKKRYRCIYMVNELKAGRYIETQHFGKDVTNNLHKIAASMVVPQKRTLFGWVDDTYDVTKHEEYANDMLSASVENVLGSVVFFYLLLKNYIEVSQDYFTNEMKREGMTDRQTRQAYDLLWKSMDGLIKPVWLQNMNALNWKKYMI